MRETQATDNASQFPVEAIAPSFLAAVESNQPVIVAAPTGSGKSTRIPEWLAEKFSGQGLVLVIEPRRVACRALATWLATRARTPLGASVGYRVRLESRESDQTRILFVTPGMAVNLAREGWPGIRAVVFDEFHERGWESDLLLTLLRRDSHDITTVICSATIDAKSIADRMDATLLESHGRSYPVEMSYQGEAGPSSQDLEQRVSKAIALSIPDGDVLVFLPGMGEIRRCHQALQHRDEEVIAVHGSTPPQQLTALFGQSSRRRIYLATNVAETSLTLPGVRTVIDSGLARTPIHRAGRSVLSLEAIAKSSMDQRAGRAGRVASGRCIRLWSEHYGPQAFTPPELQRIELDDVVLRCAGCGLAGETLDTAPWLDAPPAFAVQRATQRLQRLGALDSDRELTPTGQALLRLPADPLEARLLLEAPTKLRSTVVRLVARLQVSREIFRPAAAIAPHERDRIMDARAQLFSPTIDQVYAELQCIGRRGAKELGVATETLKQVERFAQQFAGLLPGPAVRLGDPLAPKDALVEYLLQQCPQMAFARRPRADKAPSSGAERGKSRSKYGSTGEPWGNGAEEISVSPYALPMTEPDALGSQHKNPSPVCGLVLETQWLGHGRAAKGVGRLLLPCTPHQLVAAGLGEEKLGEIRMSTRPLRVYAHVETSFAQRSLAASEQKLTGPSLCQGLAKLTLAGRLYKGRTCELKDCLHQWRILCQQYPKSATPEIDDEDLLYLAKRFEELGVETIEDFGLLSFSDLTPSTRELIANEGLTDRTLSQILEEFPREFTREGAIYRAIVEFEQQRVFVEPVNALAKKRGEPAAKFLPRYQSFRVFYRFASRKVKIR